MMGTGSTGYADLVAVSLEVALMGFMFASILAIPLGILCGRSKACMAVVNPLTRMLKAISPLGWFPVMAIVFGGLYGSHLLEASSERSFIRCAFTVTLCSLWPALAGTALGVASIEKGHIDVARMLKLSMGTRLCRIVVPAALPPIVDGQRLSMGIGWMMVVAAEMLARVPGLAGFAWDVLQKGGRAALPQIAVAVVTIAGVGLLLDRVMVVLRRSVTYVPSRAA